QIGEGRLALAATIYVHPHGPPPARRRPALAGRRTPARRPSVHRSAAPCPGTACIDPTGFAPSRHRVPRMPQGWRKWGTRGAEGEPESAHKGGAMPITSRYLLSAAMDVDPAREAVFNEVYDREHVPSLLTVPGVIAVARFKREELTLSIGGEKR